MSSCNCWSNWNQSCLWNLFSSFFLLSIMAKILHLCVWWSSSFVMDNNNEDFPDTQKRYFRAFSLQLFLFVKKADMYYQSFTKSSLYYLFFMNAQISSLLFPLFPFQFNIKPRNFLGGNSRELKWWGCRYCFESPLPVPLLWNHCSCLLLFCLHACGEVNKTCMHLCEDALKQWGRKQLLDLSFWFPITHHHRNRISDKRWWAFDYFLFFIYICCNQWQSWRVLEGEINYSMDSLKQSTIVPRHRQVCMNSDP